MNEPKIKRMFFVSTGRCGTTRIAEILKQHIPQNFTVLHQTKYSRRANILGNILYHFSIGKKCSPWLFKRIIKKNLPTGNILISTDPLISMIIPDDIVTAPDTAIVHIIRDTHGFACSMYNFTRRKKKSLIAHNLIPFWQPYLWPLENILNQKIINKYQFIHTQKNNFFAERYKNNPNYQCVDMDKLFTSNNLVQLIDRFWKLNISIPESELTKKINQSIL